VFGEDAPVIVGQGNVALLDGTIEMDLAVSGERSFPGVAFRVRGQEYEAFFFRPHQVGNPDAVQYTPVFNGVFGWQLHTGNGFWAPVSFPIEQWFTVRVAFAGDRAEAYVDDMTTPAIVFGRLRTSVAEGGVGILPGGPGVHVARFAFDPARPELRGRKPPPDEMAQGTVPGWWVSNLVAEGTHPSGARGWVFFEAEPGGLLNLARVHPLGNRLNTVFASTIVTANAAGLRAMDFGFSDRAVVYLNGQPLFAGRDDYRSRDYRFLGSIGYWSTLYLPLQQGDNELVVAVSETFGGWGLQARFRDPSGLVIKRG
jgi:hypothetical protein